MKLIAVNTVQGRKVVRTADPKNARDRGHHVTIVAAPGEEFDTKDFGITDSEAAALIASGAAKRKLREVTEADEAGAAGAASA